MKKKMPAWTVLMVICLCSGLLLAAVNMVTAPRIKEQELLAKNATMVKLIPEAKDFEDLELQESRFSIDSLTAAKDDKGGVIGYVGQSTVNGYGGPIAVTTAVGMDGLIRGISVGGDGFAETPGLGALTKEAAFTDQFIGKKPTIVLNQDGVDTVSGASTSSRAVVSGVNAVANYVYTYELGMLEESVSTYEGPIASVTAQGFGGEITVNAGFGEDGSVAYLAIDTPNETDGLGKMASEPSFTDQFIGKKGPFVYGQDGIEAISGATVTSTAVINTLNSMIPGGETVTPEAGTDEISTGAADGNTTAETEEKPEAASSSEETDPSRFMRTRPELTESETAPETMQTEADETESTPEEKEEPTAEADPGRFMRPRPQWTEEEAPPETGTENAVAYVFVSSPTQSGWLPLPEEGAYSYHLRQVNEDGSESENVIHLTPEGICMESATCDNQDCVMQGMVTLENRYERILSNMIICLPNQVFLEQIGRAHV